MNEDPFDPTKSATADYVISDNILYTTASQVAAMRIDAAKSSATNCCAVKTDAS